MANPFSAGTVSCPLFYLLVNRYLSEIEINLDSSFPVWLLCWGLLEQTVPCTDPALASLPVVLISLWASWLMQNHRKSGSSVLLSLPLTRFRVLAIGEDTNQGTKEDNLSRWAAVEPFSSLGPGHISPSHLWKSYKECPNSIFSSVCFSV